MQKVKKEETETSKVDQNIIDEWLNDTIGKS